MDLDELKRKCEEYFPDIELLGDGSVDYGHNLADLLLQAREEEKADLEMDYEFVRKADNLGLNPERIFEHFEDKLRLLKNVRGYTNLKASNVSGKESINYSSKAKVGNVFRKIYYSSLKNIKSLN